MEQAAGFGSRYCKRSSPLSAPALLLAAGFAACCAAQAQDLAAPLDGTVEAARAESPMRLEVNASALPRVQVEESSFQAPRIDLSLLPGRGSGLGLAVGMSGFSGGAQAQPHTLELAQQRPAFDLGVHWRHTLESSRQIDVKAWRRMTPPPDALTLIQQREPAVYGARVEMRLQPVRKSRLLATSGFIGMQLESGARISIKRKDGRPMVYYRTAF